MTSIIYTSTKSKSRNLTKAQLKAQSDWEALIAKHSKPLERGAKSKLKLVKGQVAAFSPPSRSTPYIPSLNTGEVVAAAKPINQYTGDRMLGVAVLHKSCLQPVFSQAAAIETAQMRRN